MSFMNPNRAFRSGLADGFTAPFRLFFGRSSLPHYSASATDARAWREIGGLLNDAYRQVGSEIGKDSRETTSKRPRKQR